MALSDIELPHGYTPLPSFAEGTEVGNVAGFVTDAMTPMITRKGDWMITYSMCDPEWMLSHGSWSGTKVRAFNAQKESLPNPKPGDIVLLRQAKTATFGGNTIIITLRMSTFVVFDHGLIPPPAFASKFEAGLNHIPSTHLHPRDKPNFSEQLYAMKLKEQYGKQVQEHVGGLAGAMPPPRAPTGYAPPHQAARQHESGSNHVPRIPTAPIKYRQKFALIEEMEANGFYDMIVEVIKIYPTPYDYVEVYVSDFTINKQLYDYPTPEEQASASRDGDEFAYLSDANRKWPGPWGQTVLKLELRHPHSAYLQQHIREHQFVRLSNVRVKVSRTSRLEGSLWPDMKWPDKILVERANPISSDQGRALLERRSKYWEGRGKAQPVQKAQKPKSKRVSASKRAQERAAAEQKVVEEGIKEIPGVNFNKHVRSANRGVPLTTISSLLAARGVLSGTDGVEESLPFINQRRRCQVRVVDFYPSQLEDFAIPRTVSEGDMANQFGDEMDIDQPAWEWNFYLLVEDSVGRKTAVNDVDIPRTWLHVSNMDAQYLLNTDACNLREDALTLNKLQEKTDVLWGNLGELKASAESDPEYVPGDKDYWSGKLSNLPFDCCIEEYGQPIDDEDTSRMDEQSQGWIRLFSLCETMVL